MADAAGTTCQVGSPEVCDDGIDNDCDGHVDCDDPDCSGVGNCPICGTVQHPLGTPLPLPDGEGAGPPYTSKLNFTGFAPNQAITALSNLQSVCVTMEHSWLRDLQIELHAPSGQIVVLQQMLGQTGSELFMGIPNDNDDQVPIPGTGWDYCWTPMATNAAMLTYANTHPAVHTMPAGDYQAAGGWAPIIGATLNGDWEIFVQDKWASDNGTIFKWTISFDPSIVQDCSGPVIQ
jgi:hypothetical protein